MNYRIHFREITHSDISIECPFMPDPEDYKIHFHAMTQDIEKIEGIIHVSTETDSAILIKTTNFSLSDLKAELKPTLQSHYQFLRILEIDYLE